MHAVQPNQICRILTVQIAVPAEADPSEVADEMSAMLTGGIADPDSNILDWQYLGCSPETGKVVFASEEPEECEIFLPN